MDKGQLAQMQIQSVYASCLIKRETPNRCKFLYTKMFGLLISHNQSYENPTNLQTWFGGRLRPNNED